MKIILASGSEWRANLLCQAGFGLEVIPTDLDEDYYKDRIPDPETLVKTLAEKKAEACHHSGTIIAADTIIFLNNEIMGKPIDRTDAKQIIQKLSGHTHDVWTGTCIKTNCLTVQPSNCHIFAEKSSVSVRPMTDAEIEAYLDTNEWVGKAGGYQIQKTLGHYITKIVGSYTNIIGLPIPKILTFIRP